MIRQRFSKASLFFFVGFYLGLVPVSSLLPCEGGGFYRQRKSVVKGVS